MSELKKFDTDFGGRLAGCDEAGRGPLAGPVVAAAVVLKEGFFLSGIKDSKKVTPKKRAELYYEIIRNCEDYSFGAVFPEEINRINILRASMKAIETAVTNLKAPFDICLVDGNMKFSHPKFKSVVKGDTLSFSIACASILAKVTRDAILEKYALITKFDFHKHKGYPTKHHINEIYENGVEPFHRLSYKPVHKTLYLKILRQLKEKNRFSPEIIKDINLIKPYMKKDEINFLRKMYRKIND